MKRLSAGAAALFFATSAQAAPVSGLTAVNDAGGGLITFIFDTVGSDIDGNSEGLFFSYGGVEITATGLNAAGGDATVRQDYPPNGGLGVLGGTDNLELSLFEKLVLSFNQSVEIVNWTFNGLNSGDGHQDAADGRFTAQTDGGSHSSSADLHDGVGGEYIPDLFSSMCAINISFCDTTSLTFANSGDPIQFKGYLESITIRIDPVPLPASAVLLLAGVAGLGAVRRLRK